MILKKIRSLGKKKLISIAAIAAAAIVSAGLFASNNSTMAANPP